MDGDPKMKWWQKAVFYQIYPRSFADGNSDGIGDFKGMLSRLDYLQDLGVDALWLSPHFPSPMYDCGYDVSDYVGVAPEYGTMDDFKAFLEGAHRRGMRVVLDLVLNHTSHQHPWFIESSSSRNNPKRDWYIWRDPRPDGSAPNNWNSTFDGSAWQFDPQTGQYYYHFFLKQQPDLNWRNPEVRRAMFDAARFWLDMGVDGFRLDAIGTIFERPDLPDHSLSISLLELRRRIRSNRSKKENFEISHLWQQMFRYQVEQPGVHELMQELRSVMDEYGPGERVLIGENDLVSYHGNGHNELHMVFNFPLMKNDRLTPAIIRSNQEMRLKRLAAISPECWPCNTLGNHDNPRLFGRYGGAQNQQERARLHLALMLTLRGTPSLYNGEEIGMANTEFQDINQLRDTLATWAYHAEIAEFGVSPEDAFKHAAALTRDRCRTPLQWKNAPNAGFCPAGVDPWLPVNPNYASGINVAAQENDPDSMLNFYRTLLHLRRRTPALIEGDYLPIQTTSRGALIFLRRAPGQACLVVLNFTGKTLNPNLHLPGDGSKPAGKVLYSSSAARRSGDHTEITRIAPWEICILELD